MKNFKTLCEKSQKLVVGGNGEQVTRSYTHSSYNCNSRGAALINVQRSAYTPKRTYAYEYLRSCRLNRRSWGV